MFKSSAEYLAFAKEGQIDELKHAQPDLARHGPAIRGAQPLPALHGEHGRHHPAPGHPQEEHQLSCDGQERQAQMAARDAVPLAASGDGGALLSSGKVLTHHPHHHSEGGGAAAAAAASGTAGQGSSAQGAGAQRG